MGDIAFYVKPRTLEEAVAVLQEKRGKACVLAGGTSLAVRRPPGVDTLVDIRGLGLDGVEDRGDSLALLACTRVADLVRHPRLAGFYSGVICRAAARMASTPVRNMITVGGNAVQVFPWSDLPGVLLALDAAVVIAGPDARTVPVRDLYAAHPRTRMKHSDVAVEVRIPKPIGRVQASYAKVARTSFDYAALTVTAVCRMNGSEVAACAVALGAVRPLPLRISQAEEEITGKTPTRDDIVRAAARAAGATDPSQDYRYSKEYRRQLIKVWVKRCLYETLA